MQLERYLSAELAEQRHIRNLHLEHSWNVDMDHLESLIPVNQARCEVATSLEADLISFSQTVHRALKIHMRILTLENLNSKIDITKIYIYIHTPRIYIYIYIYFQKLYPKDLDIIC